MYYRDFAEKTLSLKNCMLWSIEKRSLDEDKILVILAELSTTTILYSEILLKSWWEKEWFCSFYILSSAGDSTSLFSNRPNARTRQLKAIISWQKVTQKLMTPGIDVIKIVTFFADTDFRKKGA